MPRGRPKGTAAKTAKPKKTNTLHYPDLSVDQKITAFSIYTTFKLTGDPRLKELLDDLGFHGQTLGKCLRVGQEGLRQAFENEGASATSTPAKTASKYDVSKVLKNSQALFGEQTDNESEEGEEGTQDDEEPEPAVKLAEPHTNNQKADSVELAKPGPEPGIPPDDELSDELLDELKKIDEMYTQLQKGTNRSNREMILDFRSQLEFMSSPDLVEYIPYLIKQYAEKKGLDWRKVGNLFGYRKARQGEWFTEQSVFQLS